MISFGRNVLSELCQKIEWREDLKIPFRTCFEVVCLRIGKDLASIFLGFVDHLPTISYLDQSRQTKWAADHVLNQTLDPRPVPSGQEHGLVDTETAMFPSPHILDNFRFYLALGQVEGKHGFLPGHQQLVHVEFRQFNKVAFRCKSPSGN